MAGKNSEPKRPASPGLNDFCPVALTPTMKCLVDPTNDVVNSLYFPIVLSKIWKCFNPATAFQTAFLFSAIFAGYSSFYTIYSCFSLYFTAQEAKCSGAFFPNAQLYNFCNDNKGSLRDETRTDTCLPPSLQFSMAAQHDVHHVGTETLTAAEEKLSGANH